MSAINECFSSDEYSRSELIKIGQKASTLYRERYGTAPPKEEREVFGRAIQVNVYPEDIIREISAEPVVEPHVLVSPPLEIIKGIHYRSYIRSADNIDVTRIGNGDAFVFRIIEWRRYPTVVNFYYEPFLITPRTDLSRVDSNILHELDTQMSYEGESDDDHQRFAKFSETRRHIQKFNNTGFDPEQFMKSVLGTHA